MQNINKPRYKYDLNERLNVSFFLLLVTGYGDEKNLKPVILTLV